jgi:hypothetical protein
MNRRPLAILATGLIWSISPVHAVDGTSGTVAAAGAKAGTANDHALKSQAAPTDLSAARKNKKKGKGGTKGGERYMTIEMKDALVTSYRSQGGSPKGAPGGLLGYSAGNFSPNPPSPTGTPLAPPASRGAPLR